MLQVVLVHVLLHRDLLAIQLLVILRSRQRGQDEEFQAVDRQLTLQDLDVVLDRLDRILGEAEDIAAERNDPDGAPGLQHLPILRDLVLLLLRVH